MVTMAQRIVELRTEKGLSRPALSAALGFPRMAVEKFEAGRQTPTQDQQEKLASFFGVSVLDRVRMDDWMDGAFLDQPSPAPETPRRAKPAPAAPAGEGTMLDAFLTSKKFQEALRGAVLEALRSPEGQELLARAVRREMGK